MAMHQITKRLNRIFENVLGCRLEYQPNEELSLVDWDFKDLTEMRGPNVSLAPKYIAAMSTDSFGFPVRRDKELMGLAIIHGFKDARPQRLLLLAELMAMIVDYSVRADDRDHKLRVIEARMAEFAEATNVIPLRPSRYEHVLQVTETISEEHDPLMSPLLNSALLLVSTAQFPLNRVAIEIHEMSGRWAFVSVEDLPADVFSSRESIEKLGGLTLFIRDIAALTTNQQIKLAEYLGRASSGDTPHVIAAASALVDDLIHEGRLLPHLSRLFTVSTLNTTSNKSASQITKELVDASLQQLVSNARGSVSSEHQVGENFVPFNAQYFNPDDTSTMH